MATFSSHYDHLTMKTQDEIGITTHPWLQYHDKHTVPQTFIAKGLCD
jgi:hypothetical protein